MTMQFTPSPTEEQAFKQWNEEHIKTCKFYDDGTTASSPGGAIGGRLNFIFTPTGVGTAFTVECSCGATKNLTDYDCW